MSVLVPFGLSPSSVPASVPREKSVWGSSRVSSKLSVGSWKKHPFALIKDALTLKVTLITVRLLVENEVHGPVIHHLTRGLTASKGIK